MAKKVKSNSLSQVPLVELKKKMKVVEDAHNAIKKRLQESKEPDPIMLKEYKALQKQLESVRGDYFDELERLAILQKRNTPKEE